MKLTQKQKELIGKKFSELNRSNCPLCHNQNMILSDSIFEVREFHGGGIVVGGDSSVLPVISVICQGCGHTMFFNAILLGLVKQEGELAKNNEDGEEPK